MNYFTAHFIKSKSNNNKTYVLWQMGHYTYQIEVVAKNDVISQHNLHDTCFEDALEKFDEMILN